MKAIGRPPILFGLVDAPITATERGEIAACRTRAMPLVYPIWRRRKTRAAPRTPPLKPVHAVVGGGLVGLAERRVVENGVEEVVDRAAVGEHRLADVDQLARAF